MSIEEKERELIGYLNHMEDEMAEFDYLIAKAIEMEEMPENEKTEGNRISGCQAKVWVKAWVQDDIVYLHLDSSALLIKGVMALIYGLLNERKGEEVLRYQMRFIDETDIRYLLSTDRFHGMEKVVSKIQKTIENYNYGGEE